MTRTRARSCTGKTAYTKKSARIACLRRRVLGRYRAYRCKFCGGWHVGHASKPRKRRLNR